MIMSWVWTGMIILSLICTIIQGNGGLLTKSISEGAQSGITLAISIGGTVCLWTGIGNLMEHAGITGFLSKLFAPLLHSIFPTTRTNQEAEHYLSANICANLLGLGNAATPMGIQAAKRLKDPNHPTTATDELCRFIVLNTASIQLIPANVAAIRSSLGASAPFDILPSVWITSICSAGMGLFVAWILGVFCRHD